ncbi:MAG: hypothetical protein HS101_03230 [Planctomycetia bacterium]|nr:hypothetical protein [Planctomycetia bacterium]MCC7316244.1 hypothetical protein [Planctomycetota bacterium]OQY98945.1 MAG: hypothetical protein B6D36_16865 [Planctomycetes bacterium UTPLA1]
MRSRLARFTPRPRRQLFAFPFQASVVTTGLAIMAGTWTHSSRGEDPGDPGRLTILTGSNDRYKAAAVALSESLRSSGIPNSIVELPSSKDKKAIESVREQLGRESPRVVAASGEQAVNLALSTLPSARIVWFMLPNAADARCVTESQKLGNRTAGVAADPNPSDRLAWIKRVVPGTSRLILLHSTATKRVLASFVDAGKSIGVEVVGISVATGGFGEALKTLASGPCDGVLMIPDAKFYNSGTIQELILWGLRNKKPIWAFSPNLVKAGAFAGQWAEPADVGLAAADLVKRMRRTGNEDRSAIYYSSVIKRAVNKNTAERINVSFEDRIDQKVTVFGDAP